MKISLMITFIIIVGIVFLGFTTMSNDLNTQYTNGTEINTSLWSGKYNYTNQVNNSISPLVEDFNNIADENSGWFTRLGSGIVAIPHAVVGVASLALTSLGSLGGIVSNAGNAIGIPPAVIYGFIVILTIMVLTGLLSFFQKSPV